MTAYDPDRATLKTHHVKFGRTPINVGSQLLCLSYFARTRRYRLDCIASHAIAHNSICYSPITSFDYSRLAPRDILPPRGAFQRLEATSFRFPYFRTRHYATNMNSCDLFSTSTFLVHFLCYDLLIHISFIMS